MFRKTAWIVMITLLTAGFGGTLMGCGDDDDGNQDTDSEQANDSDSEQKIEHTVTFTIKVPADFDGAHDKMAAVYYKDFDFENLSPPGGFAGDTVDNPDIGPDKPYVWTGTDDGLTGSHELVVILYAPGDEDYMPDPGDYIAVTEAFELGKEDLDLGEIMLEPYGPGEPKDTDVDDDGGVDDAGSE